MPDLKKIEKLARAAETQYERITRRTIKGLEVEELDDERALEKAVEQKVEEDEEDGD